MIPHALRTTRPSPRPWPSLKAFAGTPEDCSTFMSHPLAQQVRSIQYRVTPDQLREPLTTQRISPVFTREITDKMSNVSPIKERAKFRRDIKNDTWAIDCLLRFLRTGLVVTSSILGESNPDGTMVNPDHKVWDNVTGVRLSCILCFRTGFPPDLEIAARKLCAQTQDRRYPKIYRSLETQAHALYLLGRVELERDPIWRRFAWYMLMISAGLGHLDAALLLHQLNKIDITTSPDIEQRAVIAKAAEKKLDWRATVAYSEYMISKLKRRKGVKLQDSELEPYLAMLVKASRMTIPTKKVANVVLPPPKGFLDASQLEHFEPPYKAILALTTEGALKMTASKQFHDYFEFAVSTGLQDYKDPEAAWLYAQWEVANGRRHSETWQRCAKFAAQSGNDDACFELGRYLVMRDGWYPSLTDRVLGDIRARELKEMEQNPDSVDTGATTDEEKHQEIMSQKDPGLLQKMEGITWLLMSAELPLDRPAKMLNRYGIVSGLLRQNGFLQEGYDAMLEAQEKLQLSTENGELKRTALRTVAEYLQYWDKRRVHRLLTVEQVRERLWPTTD